MLSSLRQWGGSWTAKILLGILMLSFGVFWGMGDMLRGRSALQVVATVGDREILTQDFQNEIHNFIQLLQHTVGKKVSPQEIEQIVNPEKILSQMINGILLDLEAERLGLCTSDQVLKAFVEKDERFKNTWGHFDPQRFAAFLKQQGTFERAYLEKVRQSRTRTQLIEAISDLSTPPPKALEKLLLNAQLQKRYGKFYEVTTASPRLKEDQLNAYYSEHREDFRCPEEREFTLLMIRSDALKKTGKDIGTLEDELEDLMAAGSSLSDAGKKLGFSVEKGRSFPEEEGQAPGSSGTSFFNQQAPDVRRPMIKAVFDTSLKQLGEMRYLDQAKMYFMVRVDKIIPSHLRSFEKARSMVSRALTRELHLKKTQDRAKEMLRNLKAKKGQRPAFKSMPVISLRTHQEIGVRDALKENLFQMIPGEYRMVVSQDKVYLVHLVKIVQPDAFDAKLHRPDLSRALRQTLGGNFLEAYLSCLRARYPVKIFPQSFAAALGQT